MNEQDAVAKWNRLMSRKRVRSDASVDADSRRNKSRPSFAQDWDRILFSGAFRRLHDKTQVFPFPEDDFVHSRLTHSLEVASVGRSLGRRCGLHILNELDRERKKLTFDEHDMAQVVAAACLGHDIGNPPFGHTGEDAIAQYFRGAGRSIIQDMAGRQRADLDKFEGNAQGFRILTRLTLEAPDGLRLTAATLGAFSKYPRASGDDLKVKGNVGAEKHGFNQAESDIFASIAKALGLKTSRPDAVAAWRRHPLAFLVEAADDICYSILDLEDGCRLRHIPYEEVEEALRKLADLGRPSKQEKLARLTAPKDRVCYCFAPFGM